jgi:HEAT repeat protein
VTARRLAALAGHANDAATARELTTHADAPVRATAFAALARAQALTARDLGRASADLAPEVRRRSAELAISAAGITKAVRVRTIVALLADRDADVVENACWAAGELEPARLAKTVVDALCEHATSHPDALVREAAVAALGSLGHRAGLEAILQATTDKPAIRRRAILALAPFDGPKVQAALQHALADRDWQVRQAAEDLLAE